MAGCYYESQPPEGCKAVVFKTLKGLQEHYRRAHATPNPVDSLATPMGEAESTVRSLASADSSYFLRNISADSDIQPGHLEFLGPESNDICFEHMRGVDCYCSACTLNKMVGPALPYLRSSLCTAGLGAVCYCQSCCQRGTASEHQADSVPSFQGDSSVIRFQSLSTPSSVQDAYFPQFDGIGGNDGYQFGPLSNSSTSLTRQNSLDSRTQ
jgi:hypothetical protein